MLVSPAQDQSNKSSLQDQAINSKTMQQHFDDQIITATPPHKLEAIYYENIQQQNTAVNQNKRISAIGNLGGFLDKISNRIKNKNNEGWNQLKDKFIDIKQIKLVQPKLSVDYNYSENQPEVISNFVQTTKNKLVQRKSKAESKEKKKIDIELEKAKISKQIDKLKLSLNNPHDRALELSTRMSYQRKLRQLQIRSKQIKQLQNKGYNDEDKNSNLRATHERLGSVSNTIDRIINKNEKLSDNQFEIKKKEYRYGSIRKQSFQADKDNRDRSTQSRTKQYQSYSISMNDDRNRSIGKIVRIHRNYQTLSPSPMANYQAATYKLQSNVNNKTLLYKRVLPPLTKDQLKMDAKKRQLFILEKSKKNNQIYSLKKYIRNLLFSLFDEAVQRIEQKRAFFSYRFHRYRHSGARKSKQKIFQINNLTDNQFVKLSLKIHPKNERFLQNSKNLHQSFVMITSRVLKSKKQETVDVDKEIQANKLSVGKWNKSLISPAFSYAINVKDEKSKEQNGEKKSQTSQNSENSGTSNENQDKSQKSQSQSNEDGDNRSNSEESSRDDDSSKGESKSNGSEEDKNQEQKGDQNEKEEESESSSSDQNSNKNGNYEQSQIIKPSGTIAENHKKSSQIKESIKQIKSVAKQIGKGSQAATKKKI